MIKKTILGSFLSIIFVIGIVSIVQADWTGDESQATLKLSPQEDVYDTEEEISLDVNVDTGGEDVVAAAAYINYNPEHFDVTGVDTSGSVFNSDDCNYQEDPCEIINYEGSATHTPTGTIEVIKAKPSPGVNTNDGLMATVNFRTLSTTSPSADNITLNLNTSPTSPTSSVIRDDGDGTDILSGVRNGQYSIDESAPDFSNISVSDIASTSAIIEWNTDEPATTKVKYGLSTSYGIVATSSGLTATHSIALEDLSASTTYHYQVISEDEIGNKEVSVDYTFTTSGGEPDTTSPAAVDDLATSDVTETAVDLSWTAPGDDGMDGLAYDYDIRYSTDQITTSTWSQSDQLEGEPDPSSGGVEEEYYVSVGLSPGTEYYFALKTEDEAGNISSLSNIADVTTNDSSSDDDSDGDSSSDDGSSSSSGSSSGGGGGLHSDNTPPASPADFSAEPAQNQIFLSWDNPSDSDFVRVKIFRKEGEEISGRTDEEAQLIYEGDKEEYVDVGLDNSKVYRYAIFAFDKKPNYSDPAKVSAQPEAGKTSVTKEDKKEESPKKKYTDIRNLYGHPAEVVETVSDRGANNVSQHGQFVPLNDTTAGIYEKIMGDKDDSGITENDRYSVAHFIHNGTQATKRLGAGERAGVIDSYFSAFGRLPRDKSDWQDVIKIANGRWPAEESSEAKNEAKQRFQTVYDRSPDMEDSNDNAAVTVMAYGLRPANRNTDSEAAAVKIFENIFDHAPQSAQDWDTVRAIAYSGATK